MRVIPLSTALALCLVLAPIAPASAQSVPLDQFSADRFSPAPGAGNYLMIDGAIVGGHMTPTLGLIADYAHRPFVLFAAACEGGDPDQCDVKEGDVEIVSYELTFSAMASLSLWQRLQIGLVVPLTATRGESFSATTPELSQPYVNIRGGDAFSLGDPRLSAKVRILGGGSEGFSLAGVGFLTFPVGNLAAEGHGLGDETVSGGAHVVGEFALAKLRLAANAGVVIRPSRTLLSTEVGTEVVYGVGASYDVTRLLRVVGELTAASQLPAQLDENPLEARIAGELSVGDVALLLGGGVGLISGVGVPNFRVLGGVSYRPAGRDSDGDGVSDQADACPSELEDQDGFEDEDGCPDADNDNDGLLDTGDKCPSEAEDPDGHDDVDGCLDRDNDNDGVPDGYDSCPDQAEDKDGDRDEDGCPDDDRDRDGVPDGTDKCPEQAEDTDGFGDDDGCPETDFDGDGIADDEDQCPDQPESKDGREDEDGCPEAALPPEPPPLPSAIRVTCEKIEIPGKIYFKTNSEVIQARSHALLGDLAATMQKATHITRLRVEGHTDDSGKDDKNLALSDRRAKSVMAYLVHLGVDAGRLEAKGLGETQPIAENANKVGREANRRVEFVIAEQSGDCKD